MNEDQTPKPQETKQEVKKEPVKKIDTDVKIAIIRIRGMIKVKKEIKDTISMLNLPFNNSCSIVKAVPTNIGMIKKAKDYLTWGIVDEETIKLLDDKRGKGKKYYRLHPPRGGFERKGITRPYTTGGVLGDRKEKIAELIKKMV